MDLGLKIALMEISEVSQSLRAEEIIMSESQS